MLATALCFLLIAPEGIEITVTPLGGAPNKYLLIAPEGIEMIPISDAGNGLMFLLIAPEGIEIWRLWS